MTKEQFQLFYPSERTGLFVDGAHIYGAAKQLQFDIDYKKLLRVFAGKSTIVRASYYTVIAQIGEFAPVKPLLDYLEYNGWAVISKIGQEYTNTSNEKKYKGSVITDLAVDAMHAADHLDHIVLFAGDMNLRRLVECLQRRGKRVSVVSTISPGTLQCADELRRQADNFIELDSLRGLIEKEMKPIVLESAASRSGGAYE